MSDALLLRGLPTIRSSTEAAASKSANLCFRLSATLELKCRLACSSISHISRSGLEANASTKMLFLDHTWFYYNDWMWRFLQIQRPPFRQCKHTPQVMHRQILPDNSMSLGPKRMIDTSRTHPDNCTGIVSLPNHEGIARWKPLRTGQVAPATLVGDLSLDMTLMKQSRFQLRHIPLETSAMQLSTSLNRGIS